MTDVFEKAKKNVGMRTATENVKVDIMKMLRDSGAIFHDKFPEKSGGMDEM